MSTLNQTITSTEAVAPESPTPGVAQWNQFYGVPAQTVTVAASVIVNPNPTPYPPK